MPFASASTQVMVDVDSEYSGLVIDKLTGSRKGVLTEMKESHEGKVLASICPP